MMRVRGPLPAAALAILAVTSLTACSLFEDQGQEVVQNLRCDKAWNVPDYAVCVRRELVIAPPRYWEWDDDTRKSALASYDARIGGIVANYKSGTLSAPDAVADIDQAERDARQEPPFLRRLWHAIWPPF